jgi:hypothetical protein
MDGFSDRTSENTKEHADAVENLMKRGLIQRGFGAHVNVSCTDKHDLTHLHSFFSSSFSYELI